MTLATFTTLIYSCNSIQPDLFDEISFYINDIHSQRTNILTHINIFLYINIHIYTF